MSGFSGLTFDPGGVSIDGLTINGEIIGTLTLSPLEYDSSVFFPPVLTGTGPTGSGSGSGVSDIFCVCPDQTGFVVCPDQGAFLVPPGKTQC